MNYQQFVISIKEKVALSLGNGMSLHIHTTLKNNGRERVGLTISDKHVNVSPTIYLEEYYKQFQNGDSIEDIAESILDIYHEVRFEHSWQVHTIKDFEITSQKIVYKLINAHKNELLLRDVPHKLYLDFAIVYYVLFDVDASGSATIPITNELMEAWDTTLEDLHRLASKNTAKLLPATYKPMRTVIEELLGSEPNEEILDTDIMFVLTNSLRSFGAICILYDGMLEKIGDQLGENFFLLPSSIHEMIVVPASQSPTKEHLNEMVAEINETQLELEEILSDHAYYYDCKAKTLS